MPAHQLLKPRSSKRELQLRSASPKSKLGHCAVTLPRALAHLITLAEGPCARRHAPQAARPAHQTRSTAQVAAAAPATPHFQRCQTRPCLSIARAPAAAWDWVWTCLQHCRYCLLEAPKRPGSSPCLLRHAHPPPVLHRPRHPGLARCRALRGTKALPECKQNMGAQVKDVVDHSKLLD